MNKYAQAALEAVQLYAKSRTISPRAAWEQATTQLFGEGTTSQEKGCPRDAFLGLCEAGLVKGIPQGKYCRSVLNKQYAIAALHHLRSNPDLSKQPERLWDLVMNGVVKKHNGQMHVVTGLWNSSLLVAKARRASHAHA